MKQSTGKVRFSNIILLLAVFLAVVLMGRLLFSKTDSKPYSDKLREQERLQASTTELQKTAAQEPQPQAVDPGPVTPKPLSCQEQIKADLAAKKQSYAKGQLLVTFKSGNTYTSAKEVLSVYGLVVQNENDSKASFTSRRLITAAVSPGQEINMVCQLRDDAHVQYAALDIYFNLHQ